MSEPADLWMPQSYDHEQNVWWDMADELMTHKEALALCDATEKRTKIVAVEFWEPNA